MNNAVCFVVSYVVNAAWQVPLLVAAGLAASRILRRWGTQAQHRAWVATFLLSAIAPALHALRALVPLMLFRGYIPAQGDASVAMARAGAGFALHAGTLLLPDATIWAIFGLYVSTLAWFAARFLWSAAAARTLLRGSLPLVLPATSEELWAQVRRAMAAGHPRLLCSPRVRGVVTTGAARPAIILPADLAGQWSEDDLLSALGHELAHVRRHDYAKNLLYEAVGVLMAFHPAIWIVKAQIARTREMICDAMVAERLMDRKRYRQSLLRLAQRMATDSPVAAHALGMFDANIFEERITMMKSQRTIPSRWVRATLTGCAATLLLAVAIGGTAFAKGVAATAADHNEGPNKIYEIGNGVTAPVVTRSVDAKFTKQARKAHYQGICVVGLVVGSDGRPRDVRVVRPLGMGLDENAVQAVKKTHFKPAIFEGKPVPVKIDIEVRFRLYSNGSN